jgi:hypothetical protein
MSYPTILPDPTFYPSPRLAAEAPTEKLAYVATAGWRCPTTVTSFTTSAGMPVARRSAPRALTRTSSDDT